MMMMMRPRLPINLFYFMFVINWFSTSQYRRRVIVIIVLQLLLLLHLRCY